MSIVTIFNYYKRPVVSKPLVNILHQIKTGRFQKLVKQLRYYFENDLTGAFDAVKRVMPHFTISGNYKMESDQLELVSYSGFLFMEIPYLNVQDLISVKEQLIRDPFVSACFVNALGTGLVFIVKSSNDPERHQELFGYALKYYRQLTGVRRFSKEGVEPQHTCMISLDETAYIDLNARPISEPIGVYQSKE